MIVTISYLLAQPYVTAPSYPFDPVFRLAEKMPIVLADLVIGYLLYRILKGRRGLVAAALWLFNFITIFESSIFGQFDSIVTLFLLATLYAHSHNRNKLSGFFAGLALMTKQYSLFALTPLIFVTAGRSGKPRTEFVAVVLLIALVVSAPFISSNEALVRYISNVWLTRSSLDDWSWPHFLNEFTANEFCGFFQLGALISDLTGMEFELFVPLCYFGFACLALGIIWSSFLAYRGKLSSNQALLMGLTIFLTFSWYVNPQYTLSVIPFLLLDTLSSNRRRIWVLAIFLPGLWPFLAYGLLYNFSTYAPIHYQSTHLLQPLRDLVFSPIGYHGLVLRNILVPATAFVFSFLLCGYSFQFFGSASLRNHLRGYRRNDFWQTVRKPLRRIWIGVLR